MTPLWRNREFLLLQTTHLLSSLGDRVSFIAYPLLVLAVTGSPAKAGSSASRASCPCSSASRPGSPPTATTASG